MTAIGYFVSWVVLIFASSIWRGYALSVLWVWFIVGKFGLPAINIPEAIGISLIVGYLAQSIPPEDSDKPTGEKLLEASVKAALFPALALLIGWVVTLFM